jgi:hypothetical protein
MIQGPVNNTGASNHPLLVYLTLQTPFLQGVCLLYQKNSVYLQGIPTMFYTCS